MSTPTSAPTGYGARLPESTRESDGPRVFFWFFLVVQGLFGVVLFIGLIAGLVGTTSPATGDLNELSTALDRFRVLATAAVVLAVWFVVNAFLAITYWTFRTARRARTAPSGSLSEQCSPLSSAFSSVSRCSAVPGVRRRPSPRRPASSPSTAPAHRRSLPTR